MPSPAPRRFLEIGLLVRRRDDAADAAVGLVVGLLFAPNLALVRWVGADASFEPLEALIEVIQPF